jgi:hypothetical protein
MEESANLHERPMIVPITPMDENGRDNANPKIFNSGPGGGRGPGRIILRSTTDFPGGPSALRHVCGALARGTAEVACRPGGVTSLSWLPSQEGPAFTQDRLLNPPGWLGPARGDYFD